MTPRQLRKNGVFIMQEAEFQFFTNSVLHELEYGLPDTDETRAEIKRLLQSVDLWKCRNQHPFSLSGGQMQKLVLLMACLSPKPLVVLDEPTAGLDYRSLTACARLIQTMQETKSVLIITHDPELMALVCHRCLSLRDGREFDPGTQTGLEELMEFLRCLPPEEDRKPRTSKPPVLDPRTGFLVFLLAMVAGIGTDSALIGLSFAAVVLVLLTQGKWKHALAGLGLMGAMYGAWAWMPGVVTAFLVSFFPRVVLIAFGAMTLAGREEIPYSLAALRKLRIPEPVILVLSVTLRFFPVLSKDLGLMRQSIRTRGAGKAGERLEILVVPMVFRVIRIAEALSASAETRGISLKGPRDVYPALRLRAVDFVVMGLSGLLFALGLMI